MNSVDDDFIENNIENILIYDKYAVINFVEDALNKRKDTISIRLNKHLEK